MTSPSLVPRARVRRRSDDGQATVEYFLAMLLVGAIIGIALAIIHGGGLIEQLFEAVVRQLMNDVG